MEITENNIKLIKCKLQKLKEKFSKEKTGNIENLKLIETEIANIKKKLPDLEDRSRRGNLRLDGITGCKNE